MTETQLAPNPVVQFNYGRFKAMVEPLGYRTIEAQRDFIGVSESTFWRARYVPGGVSDEFAGTVLKALDRCTYRELFFTGPWVHPKDVA